MFNAELIFIATLFFSIYSYTVYPVTLKILRNLFRKPWEKGDVSPTVSIIISAYNEEKDITEKLRNSLLLDYPEDKLEIIVSSDGSTDRTNEIVAGIINNKGFFPILTATAAKTGNNISAVAVFEVSSVRNVSIKVIEKTIMTGGNEWSPAS